jgi:hypothetical protein
MRFASPYFHVFHHNRRAYVSTSPCARPTAIYCRYGCNNQSSNHAKSYMLPDGVVVHQRRRQLHRSIGVNTGHTVSPVGHDAEISISRQPRDAHLPVHCYRTNTLRPRPYLTDIMHDVKVPTHLLSAIKSMPDRRRRRNSAMRFGRLASV